MEKEDGSAESMIESLPRVSRHLIGLKEERNVRIHLVSVVAASVLAWSWGRRARLTPRPATPVTREFQYGSNTPSTWPNGEYRSARYAKTQPPPPCSALRCRRHRRGCQFLLPRLAKFIH